ncbi:hypothetical protein AB0F73_00275 [Micromonospora purpureochromogenes]|uniref:hypothetical protein n=1 Tax=Micromonospora purpureochromogenes TaxID=47872 RepID=UPI0033EA09E6
MALPPIPPPIDSRRNSFSGYTVRQAVGLLAPALLTSLALTACGDGKAVTAATPSASASASASPSPTISPTPQPDRDGDGYPDFADTYPDDPKNLPQQQPFTLTCDVEDDVIGTTEFTVTTTGAEGRADFTALWAQKPDSCETELAVYPVTTTELAALKTSKYDGNDISVLYEICAAVDPDDTYAEPDFAASSEQIPERNAALLLCPKHPHAKKWKQAVKRGQVDVDLAAQGRLFGSGTFRVGKEIKPGTYVTTDVDGCYWERQNSSGGTIDNYFTNSARRVQVTIRSSDYAFSSERCGEWRPAR